MCCRLVAVVGGVELEESADIPKDKSAYGSKSGVPLLEDGALKMSQSLAIERYIADIAPKFSGLTPQQRAIDGMYAATKEVGFLAPTFQSEMLQLNDAAPMNIAVISGRCREKGGVDVEDEGGAGGR